MTLRYLFRLFQAFIKRFKAVILLGVFIGVLFFLIISYLLPSIDSTVIKIGIVGRYSTDNIPDDISSKISLGLTSVDANGNVNPSLSKSWESPDGGKTWIFYLDDQKTWQDGKKVTSRDITYKFSDASSEIIDESTIKFVLDSQFSAFPVIVARPIYKKGLVGSGDWKVKNVNLAGGYLQKLIITDKKKNKIVYKFYPSEERLKLAFKLGEIDQIIKIQDTAEFDNWKTVNIDKDTSYSNFVGIFFNVEDEKLSDKQLRQSLNYAISKNDFDGVRALGPISPFSWAFNPQVKQYNLDVKKTEDIKGSEIILSVLPNLLTTADKIKRDWESVGIKTEIQVVTGVPDSFQAFLATVDIPKDPDQYSLWHSTQLATNISKIKNPRIDKLLEDGRRELDQETRKKIYLDFQRFLVEEVPAIFLYHPNIYTITRK